MIGRYARSLGWKPHAPIVAGIVLLVLGIWQGGGPLFAVYPKAGDLSEATGSGGEVIELNVQSAGLPLFASGPLLECRTILEPGELAVAYRSNLPNYGAVCEALAHDVTVAMWPDAADPLDRALAWGVEAEGASLASPEAVVAALKSWAGDRIVLGALLAGAGLACIGFGVLRWSQTPREGPGRV